MNPRDLAFEGICLPDKCKDNVPSRLSSSSPDCEVLLHRNAPSDTDIHSQQTSASTAALPSEPICQRNESSRPPSSKKSKTRSLHNFFPAASETQRWAAHKAESFHWSQPRTDKIDISDDTIEDAYDSYDELFSHYIAERKATPERWMEAPLAAGERVNRVQATTHAFRPRSFASNRKRFMVSSAPERKHHCSYSSATNYDKDSEKLPWAQTYSPINLDELAVHKKKIADVQSWLSDALRAYEKVCIQNHRRVANSSTQKLTSRTNSEITCSQRPCRKRQNDYIIAIVGQARFRCSRMEKSVRI